MPEISMPGDATGSEAPPQQTPPAAEGGEFSMPEKFQGKTAEDVAKAYVELERKFSSEEPTPEQPPVETPAPTQQSREISKEHTEAFNAELSKDGKLSEASYKVLKDTYGYEKQVVDDYIAGARSRAKDMGDRDVEDIQKTVGGPEVYGKMTAWAATAMTKEEAASFNSMLQSGNKEVIKLTVAGLHARYQDALGKTGELVDGGSGADGPDGKAFQSVAEMVEAMKDPRYTKDLNYQRQVQARLKDSPIFG